MTRTPLLLLGIVMLGPSLSATAADSLCNKNETEYFSCSFSSGKTVSLCGNAYVKEESAGDWSEPDDPWLQYRFGTPSNIELAYPSTRINSLSMFFGENVRAQGGSVGMDRVMFVNRGIAYVVEYVFPYESDSYYMVEVGDPKTLEVPHSGGRKISYPKIKLRCVGKVSHELFYNLSRFLVDRRTSER